MLRKAPKARPPALASPCCAIMAVAPYGTAFSRTGTANMSSPVQITSLHTIPRRRFLAQCALSAVASSLLAACGGGGVTTSSGSALVPSAAGSAVTTAAGVTPANAAAVSSVATSTGAKVAVTPSTAATTSATAQAAAPAAKGAVVIWHSWGKTGGGLAMTEQADAFRQANAGISIEMVDTANVQKLIAALAGGTPPDVMQLVEGQLPPLAAKQALLPLDANFARDHIDLNAFWPISKDIVTFAGKTYAMPHHQGCYVFFWNKSHFQAAGLPVDQGPKTWNDVAALVPKLTKANGDQFTQLGFVPV